MQQPQSKEANRCKMMIACDGAPGGWVGGGDWQSCIHLFVTACRPIGTLRSADYHDKVIENLPSGVFSVTVAAMICSLAGFRAMRLAPIRRCAGLVAWMRARGALVAQRAAMVSCLGCREAVQGKLARIML